MSGFEIFGTVASAIAVIEATWLVKSHITSVKRAKQEKIDMECELQELMSVVHHIRTALDRQSLPTKLSLLNLLSKIDDGLDKVDKKRKGTWKVFWHLVKDDIRSIWADLERMRGFLELGLISQIGLSAKTFTSTGKASLRVRIYVQAIHFHLENAAQYNMMMDDLKRDLDDIRREVFHGNTRIEKRLDGQDCSPLFWTILNTSERQSEKRNPTSALTRIGPR
ncbi:hypothetical protein DL96DRAFT_1742178 [Flagelloscypha sp. PMI_526]|nr:hypothetical protein DL96DRAFT_1742178 [Flagelloscypha sp. PMI_526]